MQGEFFGRRLGEPLPDRASIDGRDEARFIAMKLDKNDWMSVGGLSGGIPVDGSESRYPGKGIEFESIELESRREI